MYSSALDIRTAQKAQGFTDRCRSSSLSDTTNFSEGSAASARRKRAPPPGVVFVGLPALDLFEEPGSVSQRGSPSMALSLR